MDETDSSSCPMACSGEVAYCTRYETLSEYGDGLSEMGQRRRLAVELEPCKNVMWTAQ